MHGRESTSSASGRWRARGATSALPSGPTYTAPPRGGHVCYWGAETGRYLGRTAIADASAIAGYGDQTFLAANGAGLILEAGVDQATEAVSRPGIAFDNHLRTVGI